MVIYAIYVTRRCRVLTNPTHRGRRDFAFASERLARDAADLSIDPPRSKPTGRCEPRRGAERRGEIGKSIAIRTRFAILCLAPIPRPIATEAPTNAVFFLFSLFRGGRKLADSYQYQLQSMWQKCWNTNQSLVHNLRFRERGPLKSWRPETMAEAIFSVLKEGLSLSQAAR